MTRLAARDRVRTPHDLLTAAEERELHRRMRAGDVAARNRLVECNLALVKVLIRRYLGKGLDFEDLEQLGRLGLIEAAGRFDPDRGRFTTIAHHHVLKRFRRGLAELAPLVHVPVHLQDARARVARGRAPIRPVPAAHLAAAEAALRLRAVGPPAEGEPDPIAGLASAGDDGPDHALLARLLAALPPRQAEVIRLRFGLGGGPALTLDGVGARLGVGKEAARQAERKALERLRREAARVGARSRRLPPWPGGPDPGGPRP